VAEKEAYGYSRIAKGPIRTRAGVCSIFQVSTRIMGVIDPVGPASKTESRPLGHFRGTIS